MSRFLTRNEILASRNFGVKEIEVPELDGSVYIRKWSGKDRAKFLSASIKPQGDSVGVNYDTIFDNMALVVAISLCDKSGKRLFNDNEVEVISELDADVIQKIYEEALKLNTLNATAVEDAAKNFETIQNNDSTCSLLENSDTQETSSLNESAAQN